MLLSPRRHSEGVLHVRGGAPAGGGQGGGGHRLTRWAAIGQLIRADL